MGVMAVLLFVPSFTLAMTLKPESIDILVTSGVPIEQSIEVRNSSNEVRDYEVAFMRVSFSDSAEDLTFAAMSEEESAWFSVVTPKFTLEPDETRNILVRGNIPQTAPVIPMTIAVLVREEPPAGSGITVRSAGVSLLFLHLGEKLQGNVEVLSWNAKPRVGGGSPVTLNGLFKNTGNDTVILPNEIVISDMFGREVGRTQFSPSPKRLPVGTIRSLTTVWPQTGSRHLFLGQYTFSLYSGNALFGQARVFLLSPILTVSLSLFALAILGILLVARKRLRS